MGRDFVSHYKTVEYQYGYLNDDRSIGNNPVIREVNSPLANYKFLGFGFQWVFQNGFFIGVEQTILQTHYTYKGNFLILNKNQYTTAGIIFEAFDRRRYGAHLRNQS